VNTDMNEFLLVLAAAMIGIIIGFGGSFLIYAVIEWANKKNRKWMFSVSVLAIIKGAFVSCILAAMLYLGMHTVSWLSSYENDCPCYVLRSYLVSQVFVIFFVTRSKAYWKLVFKE